MKKIDLKYIKDVPDSCKDLKVYSCKIIPPKGFCAITLFGFILIRGTEEYVIRYLNSRRGKITLNHERIHVLQGRALGWLNFYINYLYFYLTAKNRGLNDHDAYRSIPFENEAYRHEEDFDYNQTIWD